MVVVLVAAIDCAAFRTPLSGRPLSSIMLLLGGLPMASLLALAFVPLLSQRAAALRGRPFWLGFQLGGCLALLFYVPCAMHQPDVIRDTLFTLNGPFGFSGALMFCSAGLVLLVPQLILAVLGGYASEWIFQSL
jgi:hypothetical protein